MKDYNFFSLYEKTRERGQKRTLLLLGLVAALVFAAFCLFTVSYTFEQRLRALSFRIESNNIFLADPNVLEKRRRYQELTEVLNDLELYNQKTQKLSQELLSTSLIKTEILHSISQVMPTAIHINDMAADKGSVGLGGISGNKYAIAEFERNIKSLPFTENVFVAGIKKEETGFSFSISFNIKEVAN